jgi:hypothetical protein
MAVFVALAVLLLGMTATGRGAPKRPVRGDAAGSLFPSAPRALKDNLLLALQHRPV